VTRRKPAQPALFTAPGVTVRARRGLDAQLREQRRLGQLEPVDEGVVAVLRDWADTLDTARADGESAYTLSNGYRLLIEAMWRLRGDTLPTDASVGADLELAALVAAIQHTAGPDP
jgi:hypothetical protein